MKAIAFYLPQYHRIPENDEWWGEGYTEWTAVKNARPLFPGHYQPRIPLNGYYYDLLDPSTFRWQQDLAVQYAVYGFCYYHYWFMDRQLLERPFEHVLKTKSLTLPFCLSWANQPWTRTWYGQAATVLMPQEYGDRLDWERHFDYLLPAFRDERYIRVEDRPLFVFHDTADIPDCADRLNFWNDLARRNGLKGLYFVQTLGGFPIDPRSLPVDACLQFEPGYTMVHGMPLTWRRLNFVKGVTKHYLRKIGFPENRVQSFFDYDMIYRLITQRRHSQQKTYLGVFTDWDNSPRRKYRSSIFRNSSPEKFRAYTAAQIRRSNEIGDLDLLFVNAWNEWGEGAYLEPDKRFGTGYLEALRSALHEEM